MRKIAFIVFISFFVSNCKPKYPKNIVVTLVFDGRVKLPISFFDFNLNEKKLYNELEIEYENLNKLKSSIKYKKPDVPSKINSEILKMGLKKIIGQSLKIKPIFELNDVKVFYNHVGDSFEENSNLCASSMLTAKGRNTTIPRLASIVTLGCLSEAECNDITIFLNSLGFDEICKIVCSAPNPINSQKEDSRYVAGTCINSTPYRSLMNIDLLNSTPFDSLSTTFSGLNGRNANLTIVELSHPVDFLHPKFSDVSPEFTLRQETLAYGRRKGHSTWTFGTLFANDTAIGEDGYCCKGVAQEANLRKIVYTSIDGCGTTDRLASSHAALLKAINNSKMGDILLIEYEIDGKPLELSEIDVDLISTCTNVLGITVIEPIGNQGKNISGFIKSGFEFDGILVSSAIPQRGGYECANVNYSFKDIDCFGLDNILTTTKLDLTKSGVLYSKFGLSSGASAIIAGLALDIQGYYFTKVGCYLTPQQMKCLFRNTPSSLKVTKSGVRFNQVVPDAMNLKLAVDSLINGNTNIKWLYKKTVK